MSFTFRSAAIAVAGALVLSGLVLAAPALADINGCPNGGTGSAVASDRVGATATVNGNDVDYTFESFVSEGSDGIPGLIAFCVYSDTQPDTTVTVATGADGSAWQDPPSFDNFDFERAGGNPSNVAYDGASHAMGTATWDAGVPANYDKILLHINDAAECDRLYGGNPGTCFVFPGENTIPPADDLTISKTAAGSFDESFTWTIGKVACKNGTGFATGKDCVTTVKQAGGTATFNYAVSVSHDAGTVSNVKVTGTITVTNPNEADVTIDGVTDQLSDGTDCTVTDGGSQTVAPGDTTFAYECSLGSVPGSAITNKATVSWATQDLGDGSHLDGSSADTGDVAAPFTGSETDECVTVSDTNPAGPQGAAVCVGDPNPKTFSYSVAVPVPSFDCKNYDNTASFTANDTGATGSASKTVTVCGPAKTGALTMGYWQNKNGQSIITGQAKTGVCPSATWLRTFAPFQDLSATATCAQVATYVTNVIKAANASGAAMNAMLKAQMLATALDVYFSDPALGGNKISAPGPIGAKSIDLTMICKMIDGSSGTATCSGVYQNTSAAFGGATSLTVSQILAYAASQSNVGGSVWYGQVKVTQELAKNTFDAINNQVAFSP